MQNMTTFGEVLKMLQEELEPLGITVSVSKQEDQTDSSDTQPIGVITRPNPPQVEPVRKEASLVRSSGFLAKRVRELVQHVRGFTLGNRLGPQDVSVIGNRGIEYARLGLLERAIQDFDEAIRLNPTDAIAQANRGIAYQHLGMTEEAESDFEKARELGVDTRADE